MNMIVTNRLAGKVIVVAGGAANIGAASAKRMAREGASVFLGARNVSGAQAVADEITQAGGRAAVAAFEATDEPSIAALIKNAEDTFGGIDGILINMAELKLHARDTNIVDMDMEVFDHAWSVNLRGHILCARHAIPALLRRGGGTVVFTSSSAAFMSRPRGVAYTVTKHALTALMHHVAAGWGKQNVRANIVAPGLVMSEKNRTRPGNAEVLAITPSPRLGEVEDIAAAITMLMSPDGEWINGQVLCVDGGVTMR